MNELTVTETVTQKIWTTVTNCNSKVFVTTVTLTVTQKKIVTQNYLLKPCFKYLSVTSSNIDAQPPAFKNYRNSTNYKESFPILKGGVQ